MATAKYLEKDQNWADETTIYWFEFNEENYGVIDDGGIIGYLYEDGSPINDDEALENALRKACIVTDEIIAA